MSLAASTDLLYGVHPVLEALRAKDVGVHRIYLQEGRRGRAVEEILRLAKARHVPVAFEARGDLDRRAGAPPAPHGEPQRTRLKSSPRQNAYAGFCLQKKKKHHTRTAP